MRRDLAQWIPPTCESTLLTGSMLAKKEFKKKIKVKSIWELLDKALT